MISPLAVLNNLNLATQQQQKKQQQGKKPFLRNQVFLKPNSYEGERQKNIFITRDVITLNLFIKRKFRLCLHNKNLNTAKKTFLICLLTREKGILKIDKNLHDKLFFFRRNAALFNASYVNYQ